jgi:hypothetical protein
MVAKFIGHKKSKSMKNILIIVLLSCILLSCHDELKIKPQEKREIKLALDKNGRNSSARSSGCSSQFNYEPDNAGRPVGGGTGYPNSELINNGTVIVNSAASLKLALTSAQSGDTVFIPDSVIITIDSPDYFNLPINTGVTLASNRGSNGSCGALIKVTNNASNDNIFIFAGENTRITGLRFEGPSLLNNPDVTKRCIFSDGYNNILIDNNEIYDWPKWAIAVEINASQGRYSSSGITIRNNYIHDNTGLGKGWGYGVVLGGSFNTHPNGPNPFALIKGNLFSNNRHDISSSGLRGSGYEASYNVVLGGNYSSNFDVHGGRDHGQSGIDADIASTFIHIHHNTFFEGRVDHNSIGIRGIPTYMALINNNKFIQKIEEAIVQASNTVTFGPLEYQSNVFAWNNVYECTTDGISIIGGKYKGSFVSQYSRNFGTINPYDTPGPDRNGDTFTDFEMMDFALGDFDGNGITEIFKIDATGSWYTTNIPEPELGSFPEDWGNSINSAPGFNYSHLVFRDFNGDGATDVFKTNLVDWHISYGASTPWTWVNSASTKLAQMAFGDFNGNGSTDIFKTNLVDWHISYGAATPWTWVNSSSLSLAQMAFGNFDGIGGTDVFKTNLVDWHYSKGAKTQWQLLIAGNGQSMNDLLFIDINNDGQMDVLKKDPGSAFHKVSWSGSTNWRWFNYSSYKTLLDRW